MLVAGYQLPLNQYSTYVAADTFNHALVERLSNKPGVVAAGITSVVPASDFAPESAYTIEGQPAETWKLKFAMFGTTYGDYFRAMGIRLLEGRTFTSEDREDTPLVVIVNQSMARPFLAGTERDRQADAFRQSQEGVAVGDGCGRCR